MRGCAAALSVQLVHESQYMAEVDVELVCADEGWSPYLSLEDAQKLDEVRGALRARDIKAAAKPAWVHTLTLVSA